MNALHEGTESYLLELFIKSDIMREHRGCETLMKKDMSIAKYMDHKCINVR